MPRPDKLKGTGSRNYVCETCESVERLPYAGIGYEMICGECGGTSYCDPFPPPELMRRLDVLVATLEIEVGKVG